MQIGYMADVAHQTLAAAARLAFVCDLDADCSDYLIDKETTAALAKQERAQRGNPEELV